MSNLKNQTLYLLLLFLVCYSCKEDEVISEYPGIRTLPVSDISPEGAVFHGEIALPGRQAILENGFIWHEDTSPLLDISEKKVLQSPVSTGQFSTSVNTALKPDTRYYVKAYAKTKDYLVYGQEQSFVSQGSNGPEIISIQPESGVWGDTVLIKGTNFSYQQKSNSVRFGEVEAQLISANDSLLITTVPFEQEVEKVNVSVTVTGNTATSSQQFNCQKPEIFSFSPFEATFNDTIEIKGRNLRVGKLFEIKFSTALASPVMVSPGLIKVIVPPSLQRDNAKILLTSKFSRYTSISSQKFSLLAPVLTSFSPDTVKAPNQIISIKGKNFNPVPEYNTVTIDGYEALVLQATATHLQVRLPDKLVSDKEAAGSYAVKIGVDVSGKQATFADDLIIHW